MQLLKIKQVSHGRSYPKFPHFNSTKEDLGKNINKWVLNFSENVKPNRNVSLNTDVGKMCIPDV